MVLTHATEGQEQSRNLTYEQARQNFRDMGMFILDFSPPGGPHGAGMAKVICGARPKDDHIWNLTTCKEPSHDWHNCIGKTTTRLNTCDNRLSYAVR